MAVCAIGAVGTALFLPYVWRQLLEHPLGGSLESNQWIVAVLGPVPACFALLAVVLTARAPIGTVIAVVSEVVALVANLAGMEAFRSFLGVEDYLTWLLWAVLFGCALLGADALAWRLGSFTVVTGALAGVLVGVLEGLVRLVMFNFDGRGFSVSMLPAEYWIQQHAIPIAMFALVGAVAGVAVQRSGVRQETAGLA
jgi:hypothetical protein